MVNFNLDFQVWVKTGELDGANKNNKKSKEKCKMEPLEVSGHWFSVLRQPTCPRVFFFLALGRMTYIHFPNRIFI